MKKIFISILLVFLLAITANATTVLYRISSGEVVSISATDKTFPTANLTYFGKLTNPPLTDGTDWLDPSYNRCVLGYAKINDGGTIRNATQVEIDTFDPLKLDDRNKQEVDNAKAYFQNDPEMRRILTAFADVLVSEINILRSEHGLADRTLSQVKTAIINRISKDD